MSGRVLDFAAFAGGADNVVVLEMFNRTKKTYTYNFNQNISAYTFSADMQSILIDTLTYDRTTGLPNFTESNVTGYFNNYASIAGAVTVVDAVSGLVEFTIPDNRYTGNLYPNAREDIVATVVSFEWSVGSEKESHRFLILERWEPSTIITMGDPKLNVTPAYTSLVTA